ncbi:MAG: 30S ribosomal protein S17 [Spirochaetes bacterium GWF1_41_5]|nr:MAG: 30S ribosomal protein S17 [Spirochaetes bacterium GWF1_41_5]HBE03489.1 30S ribosomal protein S17 [Spirochaetia bacterium]
MKKNKRILEGVVVSNKMQKTAVVRVDTFKIHKTYKKRFKWSKNYKIHDENNKCRPGDIVSFLECRPLSKTKRFTLKQIIKEKNENIDDIVLKDDVSKILNKKQNDVSNQEEATQS